MIKPKNLLIFLIFILFSFNVFGSTWENFQLNTENSGYSTVLKTENNNFSEVKTINIGSPKYMLTNNPNLADSEILLFVFYDGGFSSYHSTGIISAEINFIGNIVSNPTMFDIDNDNSTEIIINTWDKTEGLNHLYIFNQSLNNVISLEYNYTNNANLTAIKFSNDWKGINALISYSQEGSVKTYIINASNQLTEYQTKKISSPYNTLVQNMSGGSAVKDINNNGLIDFCFVSRTGSKGFYCVDENLNIFINKTDISNTINESMGLAFFNSNGGNNEIAFTYSYIDSVAFTITPRISSYSSSGNLLNTYSGQTCLNSVGVSSECLYNSVSYPVIINWQNFTTDYICFYYVSSYNVYAGGVVYNTRAVECVYAGNLSIMPNSSIKHTYDSNYINTNYVSFPVMSQKSSIADTGDVLKNKYIDFYGVQELKTYMILAGLGIYRIGNYQALDQKTDNSFINGNTWDISHGMYSTNSILTDFNYDESAEIVTSSENAVYIYSSTGLGSTNNKPSMDLISAGSSIPMCKGSTQYYFLTQYQDVEGDALTLNVKCGDNNAVSTKLGFYGELLNVSCLSNETGVFNDFVYLYDSHHIDDRSVNISIIRTVTASSECYDTLEGGFNSVNDSSNIGDNCNSDLDCTIGFCNYGKCDLITTGSCDVNGDCLSGICSKGICKDPTTWELTDKAKNDLLGDDTNTNNLISIIIMLAISGTILLFGGSSKLGLPFSIIVFFVVGGFLATVGWLSGFIFFMMILGFIFLIIMFLMIFSNGG